MVVTFTKAPCGLGVEITVDKELARRVGEVDLVVGRHSHTFLYTGPPPSVERPQAQGEYPTYVVQDSGRVVPVVQAYCYNLLEAL